MNNNINCESCYQVICECDEIIAEQEAIERLQAMPVETAVLELWPNESVGTIARVLQKPVSEVCEILGVDEHA